MNVKISQNCKKEDMKKFEQNKNTPFEKIDDSPVENLRFGNEKDHLKNGINVCEMGKIQMMILNRLMKI